MMHGQKIIKLSGTKYVNFLMQSLWVTGGAVEQNIH